MIVLLRHSAYRLARNLGEVQAVKRAVARHSVAPLITRAIRRRLYRADMRWMARLTKALHVNR